MQITLKELEKHLSVLIKTDVTPYIKSSPAIGKSSLAHQIADKYKLKLIDVRLAQCDPVDIAGFPYFDNETKKASYFPLDTFPTEKDEIPKGYNGWLLLLDEFSSASIAVQAAAYRLILDKEVGQHKLHPRVKIIACGNLETDNAIVNPMSSALISRFAHFEVRLSKDDWCEWAIKNKLNPNIISYINYRPECLYQFNPDNTEPYASPRTWEMLSKVLSKEPTLDGDSIPLLGSLIGDGVAAEFLSFLKLQDKLPKFADIVNNPTGIKIDDDLSIKWALIGLVTRYVTPATIEAVCKFIDRFPAELKVIVDKQMHIYHPELANNTEYGKWRLALAKEIYG